MKKMLSISQALIVVLLMSAAGAQGAASSTSSTDKEKLQRTLEMTRAQIRALENDQPKSGWLASISSLFGSSSSADQNETGYIKTLGPRALSGDYARLKEKERTLLKRLNELQ